jgi:hypothetical protein
MLPSPDRISLRKMQSGLSVEFGSGEARYPEGTDPLSRVWVLTVLKDSQSAEESELSTATTERTG